MVLNEADVFPGVTEVGQMCSSRMEAVLVGRILHGVGEAVGPDVGIFAFNDVVTAVRLIARVGDSVRCRLDAVGGLVAGLREIISSVSDKGGDDPSEHECPVFYRKTRKL